MANGILGNNPWWNQGLDVTNRALNPNAPPPIFPQQATIGPRVLMPQPAQQDQAPQGFRQRAAGLLHGIGSALKDPNVLDQLTIGFAGMSTRPNEALIKQASNRIEQRQELAAKKQELASQTEQVNKTAEYFRSIDRDDLAQAILNNPQASNTILQEYIASKFQQGGERTADIQNYNFYAEQEMAAGRTPLSFSDWKKKTPVGIPQTDERTGQVYIVLGDGTRQNIEGAFQETPTQRYNRETEQAQIDLARERGIAVFSEIQNIDRQSRTYDQMLAELDAGADVGVLRNYFPAINAETAQLRSLANRLGLDIVAGGKFGPLSEGELSLALATAIDINMSESELRKQIIAKQQAQAKLRAYLEEQANVLTSGIRFDVYIGDSLRRSREANTSIDSLYEAADRIVDGMNQQ